VRGIRAVCAISAVALAACSSPAQPETLPAVTNDAPPSPPASETTDLEPQTSEETATATSDIAAAALENYLKAANRASRGEELEEFRTLFAESCGICMSQYNNFTSAYSMGNSATGTLYTNWSIETVARDGDQVVVQTVLDTGDIELRDLNGDLIDTFNGESGIATAWTLKMQEDTWLVVSARDLT
jgi:hypothetical protein